MLKLSYKLYHDYISNLKYKNCKSNEFWRHIMSDKKFKIIFGIIGILAVTYNLFLAFVSSSFEFSLIYIILACLSAIVFALLIFSREKNYTIIDNYQNSDIFLYDKINKLKLQLEETNDKLDEAHKIIRTLQEELNKR